MSIKTKTTAAVALAALAVPGAAIADAAAKSQCKSKSQSHGKSSQAKSHKAKSSKGKAFTIRGVDFGGVTLNDDKELTAPLTLDPTSANKHARKFLEVTRTELRGEDTVTFGEADDAVILRYVGLESTDTLQPTDQVKVIGKVQRNGDLNIRKITVIRETAENETETQS